MLVFVPLHMLLERSEPESKKKPFSNVRTEKKNKKTNSNVI
jgi:hypothetical protein